MGGQTGTSLQSRMTGDPREGTQDPDKKRSLTLREPLASVKQTCAEHTCLSKSLSSLKRVLFTVPVHRWPRPMREERRNPVTLQVFVSSQVMIVQSPGNFGFMICLLDLALKPEHKFSSRGVHRLYVGGQC